MHVYCLQNTKNQIHSFLDQPNFQMARVRMAQIYLEQKHDRIRFSQCYK